MRGFRYKHTSVYIGVGYQPRDDNEYALALDAKHHLELSPLVELGIGLVT